MKNSRLFLSILSMVLLISYGQTFAQNSQRVKPPIDIERIKLPDGFKIEIYAEGVPNARAMALSPSGTLFVGSRRAGNVYAVVDTDGDYKADKVYTLAKTLKMPTGLAFSYSTLYVADKDRILKFEDIENHLENPPSMEIVYDDLPSENHHGWKYLGIGPDGKLYFDIGAPSNARLHDMPFTTISRINTDGSDFEPYVFGVRHSVGFDWDPNTGELWFTDNGRDNMYGKGPQSNNFPPDELNHVTKMGQHFGYPYIFGTDLKDPVHGEKKEASEIEFTPTAMNLAPHAAALGMKFYTGDMFPDEYKGQIFIAEHGSWNISEGNAFNGNRITLVKIKNNKAISYEVFAEGWLIKEGRTRFGRPADILIMPDGSMLISDDYGDVIYRITYDGKK